ncbi:MAG: hypothetical protein K6A65_01280 [Succinivibrionaceae bacterium]|nr:hypothetical protein [Succinivibrionaceae bacterium]
MMDLSAFGYFFVVCEGTAEQDAVEWILSEDSNSFLGRSHHDLSYIRARSKSFSMRMVDEIQEFQYPGKVAVLYVHDSRKERWHPLTNHKSSRTLSEQGIGVIDVITAPEIEILPLLSQKSWFDKWGRATKEKPSTFLSHELKRNDLKRQGTFVSLFESYGQFVSACGLYKRKFALDGETTIFDLT